MSFPRRSARLSPHVNQQQQRQQQSPQGSAQGFTQFSQPSSTSTTSFPSPSNDSSNPPPPPPTPAQARLQVHTSFASSTQQGNYAPLPSPSVDTMGQGAFFTQGHPQQDQGQQQQYSTQQQQTTSPSHHGHQQGHHNSLSQPHPPNIQNANPGQLPPDFLAEAAKRAQMACLMRDLGDVSL